MPYHIPGKPDRQWHTNSPRKMPSEQGHPMHSHQPEHKPGGRSHEKNQAHLQAPHAQHQTCPPPRVGTCAYLPDATSPCSHTPVRANQTDTTATIIVHDTTLSRTPKREASPPPIEAPCSSHSFTLVVTNRNTISTEKRQRRKRTQATTATDQGMGLNPCVTTPYTHHPAPFTQTG